MKKITGKVVSLVLALALVVTSFSANFAFASTKKTLSGVVSDTEHDDLYLVNDSGNVNKEYVLDGWLDGVTLETKEHDDVASPTISAVSHVSGDKLTSFSTKDDKTTLKLKGKTGTEVVSVLYEGDYTDPDDDNDTEYTVKGKANLTIHVYDEGDIVFGEAKAVADGEGLDDFKTFARNKNAQKDIGIYKAVQSATAAPLAQFTPVTLVAGKDDGIAATDVLDPDNTYYYEMTSGDSDVHVTALEAATSTTTVTASSSNLTATVGRSVVSGYYTKDASTGNVTINVKKLEQEKGKTTYKASNDSDDKYTLKTKVDKKVDVSYIGDIGSGKVGTIAAASIPNVTIEKGDVSSSQISGAGLVTTDVKDCEVVFPEDYTGTVSVKEKTNIKKISGEVGKVLVDEGKVGEIDLDQGNVEVSEDSKVGDITTDGDTGTVLVTGGTVGNIKTSDVDVSNAGTVDISGGTVGDVKANDKVTISSDDEDNAVTVGTVTATSADISTDEGKLTVKGIKVKADGGEILLYGDKLTVGSIDADYRETSITFGDEDDEFVGKVSAPTNAKNVTLSTVNEDTDVTVSGTVNVDTISIDTDSTITFDGNITVDSIDGDGTMKIAAGKLYVNDSVSSVILKLTDTNLAAGTTVFKADKDNVDEEDFEAYGFTLEKSTGNDVDTFKIKTLSFAGIAIDPSSAKIAKGYSQTFTASAYPNGTSLPAGSTIKWDLDGGSSDVFTLTTSGNTAKIEIASIDADFASENTTTLTATLYGEDGDELDDYDAAKCEVTAIAVPEATSDTTKDFSVAKGSAYQFKITSATAPTFTTGTAGVFSVALASKNGNDYFYKITAIGNVGASTGIYLNGVKLLVASVKAPAFTTDTTKDVTVKGAYTLKVTAAATPTFALGTAGVFKAEFVSKTGNDYLYKITSVGAVGAKTGVYVNGVKTFVATVG